MLDTEKSLTRWTCIAVEFTLPNRTAVLYPPQGERDWVTCGPMSDGQAMLMRNHLNYMVEQWEAVQKSRGHG